MIAPLNPIDWERVEALFHQAIQLGDRDRARFLSGECATDLDLRRAVERLISGHFKADAQFIEPVNSACFLKSQTPAAAAADISESAKRLVGRRVGAFTLTRLIAVGGVGAVYEARQQRPNRVVALKVLRGGLTAPDALKRFEYESEVLARLQHPNIAKVFEAGHFRDGSVQVPFFAMEYVTGAESIVAFAASRRLDIRDRLRLFVDVCEAVHHAHQRGIIHRDLKPGNVLVDRDGAPKVIDFGVARIADSDIANTLQTGVGQIIGTVPYMSPEQFEVNPRELDTRSDVYSLGVLLYELLSDRLPHDVRSTPIASAARIIKEDPPTRLSTLNHLLKGDLETITSKALEKERDRRYQSVAELTADLRRFLRNEPISARPPTLAYQTRKLFARHRLLCTSVAASFVLITAFAVSTWVQSARIADQRDQIAREAENTRRSGAFLRSILGFADPRIQGKDVTVREALDDAAQRVGDELGDAPEVEADVRQAIATAYFYQSRFAEAEEQDRIAWEIYRDELGTTDEQTVNALAQYTNVLRWRGRNDQAMDLLAPALADARQSSDIPDQRSVQLLRELAKTESALSRHADATEHLQRALAIQEALVGPVDGAVASILEDLADVTWDASQREAAIQFLRRALDMRRRTPSDERFRLTDAMYNLGFMLSRGSIADAVEAEAILNERLELIEDWGDENNEIAVTLSVLGAALETQGRTDEAEQLTREALSMKRRVLGNENYEVANTLISLAMLYGRRNRAAEAEPLWQEALALRRKLYGPVHDDTLNAVLGLTNTLEQLGQLADAENLMRPAIKDLRERSNGGDQWLAVFLAKLGRNLSRQGLDAEACSTLSEARALHQTIHGSDSRQVKEIDEWLGRCSGK